MAKTLEQVRDFWNQNLCGSKFVRAQYPDSAFFEEYTAFRYRKTHHLDKYIDWAQAAGKDVLEIGLGIGADAIRWARHARSYTGIDITEESVIATRQHFEYKGLEGDIVLANAEEIPFENERFDLVYSHGVLHHTPEIMKALSEANRVLRSNGRLILMLYCRNSFNYWIRIQGWFRLRMLFEWLNNKVGGNSNELWSAHLSNLKKVGWRYFSWSEWPHHCTDGPDCQISNIFTPAQVRRMLRQSGFTVVELRKAHFPLGVSPWLERAIARFMGFHQLIRAIKN
ncbi:MAG: class I SAM-dependent methyltransferase [Flavobacteriales bacterium]